MKFFSCVWESLHNRDHNPKDILKKWMEFIYSFPYSVQRNPTEKNPETMPISIFDWSCILDLLC